jgi:hypothetical protein
MFHRIEHVLRSTGAAVQGAVVTVFQPGTTTEASIFSDAALSIPLANPLTTDANGRYAYYIADGLYDETVTYGTITATESNIPMFAGSAAWGSVAGSLSAQADLQAALDAKVALAALSELIDDRVAALLVAGTNVTLTYNDVAGTLTIASSGGGSAAPTILSKSATYSETATSGQLVVLCTGTFAINLPTAVGNTAVITVKCLAGAVTLDPAGAETIDGGATAVVNVAGASITLVSDGANWEII